MAPAFTVITDPSKTQDVSNLIKKLSDHYQPFVDSVHNTESEIKRIYNKSNAIFFRNGKKISLQDVNEFNIPELVLTREEPFTLEEEDLIHQWLMAVIDEYLDEDLDLKMKSLIPQPENLKLVTPIYKKLMDVPKGDPTEYGFRFALQERMDFGVCEIIKPFTDKPYTVVLRKFKEKGFERLFTSLYICSSWGVCSHDHAFLHHLWKHLEMDKTFGVLDLQDRLRKDIQSCYPKEGEIPNIEPEVYRLTLEDTIGVILAKRKYDDDGEGQK